LAADHADEGSHQLLLGYQPGVHGLTHSDDDGERGEAMWPANG
jgi:hypothetical protein